MRKGGLPCYGTEEQFEIMINKRKYKELCRKFGVPTVEEYKIDESFQDEDFDRIKYPVLVNPQTTVVLEVSQFVEVRKSLKRPIIKLFLFLKVKKF